MPTNVVGMECTCSAGRDKGRVSTQIAGPSNDGDVTRKHSDVCTKEFRRGKWKWKKRNRIYIRAPCLWNAVVNCVAARRGRTVRNVQTPSFRREGVARNLPGAVYSLCETTLNGFVCAEASAVLPLPSPMTFIPPARLGKHRISRRTPSENSR